MNVYAQIQNTQPMIAVEDPNMVLLRADNTEKKYSRASKVYDEFATKKGWPLFNNLSSRDLAGERGNTIGLSYAVFLLEYRQGISQEYYAVNTILEYYKGWLNKLSKRRGTWKRVIENAKNDWSHDIYSKLQMRASVAAIKRGESVNKKQGQLEGSKIWREMKKTEDLVKSCGFRMWTLNMSHSIKSGH